MVYEVSYWLATLRVVDGVAKARSVEDCETELDSSLHDVHSLHLDFHGPLHPLLGCGNHTVGVKIGEKERLDQGGLAKSALPHNHQGKLEPFLEHLPADFIGKLGQAKVSVHFVQLTSQNISESALKFEYEVGMWRGEERAMLQQSRLIEKLKMLLLIFVLREVV